MKLDEQKLAMELIRAIRGRRSQVAFSRRLGYRSNVAHSWESGRRWPTAAEAFRAAALCGIDVDAALRGYLRGDPSWLSEVDVRTSAGVAALMRHELGDPVSRVAERAGVNRFTVSRWLRGLSEPRLPDFLRLMEAMSLRVVDLVAALVDPASVPSVRRDWERREARRSMAVQQPWSQGVLRSLEVAPGAVEDVARRLGIDEETAQHAVSLLLSAGHVRRAGSDLQVVKVDAVDTRRTRESALRLKSFWTTIAVERLSRGDEGQWSYNLMSLSRRQFERLVELETAHFAAIRALVAEPDQPELVALFTRQLVRLDPGPS